MPKEYSYGIAPYTIINDEIHVLMNKTSKFSRWNFFKGKIESDETIEETAMREFEEEAGICIEKSALEDYFFQYTKRKNIGIFLTSYLGKRIGKNNFYYDRKEIYSAKWVKLENVVVSKNQSKIANKMILYFKEKEFNMKIANKFVLNYKKYKDL